MAEPDLLDLLAEIELAENPWTGPPLGYTTDYWSPDDLLAAFDRYVAEHGHFASYPQSHMWTTFLSDKSVDAAGHECVRFSADTRFSGHLPCPLDHDHTGLPDKLMSQAICSPCSWHVIATNENAVVEAWHDHALPGWRDLPVMPLKLSRRDGNTRLVKAAMQWLDENQPPEWRFPGAPIRTGRQPLGTRHVSGRSPFGGYDLGHDTSGDAT